MLRLQLPPGSKTGCLARLSAGLDAGHVAHFEIEDLPESDKYSFTISDLVEEP